MTFLRAKRSISDQLKRQIRQASGAYELSERATDDIVDFDSQKGNPGLESTYN